MEDEPHPDPEPVTWRLGVPASTVVLALGMGGALVAVPPGPALTTVVAVCLVLMALGVIARGRRRRRTASSFDRPGLIQNFAWLWAFWSGTPQLIPLDSDQRPAVQMVFGLLFAAITTAFLWFALRPIAPRRASNGSEPDRAR